MNSQGSETGEHKTQGRFGSAIQAHAEANALDVTWLQQFNTKYNHILNILDQVDGMIDILYWSPQHGPFMMIAEANLTAVAARVSAKVCRLVVDGYWDQKEGESLTTSSVKTSRHQKSIEALRQAGWVVDGELQKSGRGNCDEVYEGQDTHIGELNALPGPLAAWLA